MIRSVILPCLAGLVLTGAAVASGTPEDSREFARGQDGCGLDHGYACVEPREEDFLSLESHQRMLPGNWLRAWESAQSAFQSIPDLTPDQRELRHYKIGFAESESAYIVHFQPLLLPQVEDGKVTGMIRDAIGRQTRFWIDKKDFSVQRQLFYK